MDGDAGRQCLLDPVEFTPDGWFRMTGGDLSRPLAKPAGGAALPHGMALSDAFSAPLALGSKWSLFRPEPGESARDYAVRAIIKLASPATAKGQPAKPAKPEPKTHGMLKDDQPAYVTANALNYDGDADKAIYTGSSRLWQGDTAVSADTITIDEKTGDLFASRNVRSTQVMQQTDEQSKDPKKVPTIATADDMHYEDALHRNTYTINAHMIGQTGDLRPRRSSCISPKMAARSNAPSLRPGQLEDRHPHVDRRSPHASRPTIGTSCAASRSPSSRTASRAPARLAPSGERLIESSWTARIEAARWPRTPTTPACPARAAALASSTKIARPA